MNRDELKKLIVGPVAPVPTPFDDDFEVDLGLMADLTEWWVECGAVTGKAVIKIAAQAGEGDKLRDWEGPALLRTAVQAAKGKAAVMGAIHHKDTVRAVEDAKKAQDLGAIGVQISPPIFNSPDQNDHLRHYEAISDAIDIGVMIYNTPWWPYGSISPETFRKMADFEHIAAIKWSPPEGYVYKDIFDLKETFNIIDNTVSPVLNHKMGGRGYVQNELGVYPFHDLRIWELMEAGPVRRGGAALRLGGAEAPCVRQQGEGEDGTQGRRKGGHGDHGPAHRPVAPAGGAVGRARDCGAARPGDRVRLARARRRPGGSRGLGKAPAVLGAEPAGDDLLYGVIRTCIPNALVIRMTVAKVGLPLSDSALYSPSRVIPTSCANLLMF